MHPFLRGFLPAIVCIHFVGCEGTLSGAPDAARDASRDGASMDSTNSSDTSVQPMDARNDSNADAGLVAAECGNNLREGNEQCDGADRGAANCQTLGFAAGGTLSCSSSCQLVTSACTPNATCGNGQVDDGEQCDGSNLRGESCMSRGYASGDLSCAQCRFVYTACANGQGSCGNGVRDGNEECDGNDTNFSAGCTQNGCSGGLATCDSNCRFNLSLCQSCNTNLCGNGSIDSGEDCEAGNNNGASCQSLGFTTGTLACNTSCRFNTSGCQGSSGPTCGNGIIESGESCEGSNFNGASCQSHGFDGGSLSCNNCQIVDSACTRNQSGDCITCTETPPVLHRTYTDGQSACTLSGLIDGNVKVGVYQGVHYLYTGNGGPTCRDGRCIAHNTYGDCLNQAGWGDDIDYFVEPPGGSHPFDGWRPKFLDSTIETRRYCNGDVIAYADSRPIQSLYRSGQWQVHIRRTDGDNLLCRVTPELRRINITPVEPNGQEMPRFILDQCFPAYNNSWNECSP